MRVVHGKVGDDDWHWKSNHQHPSHCTHGANKHAQVGLWNHVTKAHSGHGDQGPPQAKRDGTEVIPRIDLDPFCIVDKAGEDDNTKDKEEHKKHQLLCRGTEGLEQYF